MSNNSAGDRDWTWVLDRPCDECGAAVSTLSREELAGRVRSLGGAWREMLGRGALVTQPPHGDSRTWSILEYGAHVRDVFDLFEDRIRTMLKKRKAPTFKDWNQDDAASGYADEDPNKVSYSLASNAGKVADVLDRVKGDEWSKEGKRSDGAEFTVESIARYLIHDVEHHLWDAHQILDGQ